MFLKARKLAQLRKRSRTPHAATHSELSGQERKWPTLWLTIREPPEGLEEHAQHTRPIARETSLTPVAQTSVCGFGLARLLFIGKRRSLFASSISFNENDFRPINAFTIFEAPQNNNISQFQTHQHACQHVARICRSFWLLFLFDDFSFLFSLVSMRPKPTCAICTHVIQSKGKEWTINCIQDIAVRESLAQRTNADQLRIHPKCAKNPHIHGWKKVGDSESKHSQHISMCETGCLLCAAIQMLLTTLRLKPSMCI